MPWWWMCWTSWLGTGSILLFFLAGSLLFLVMVRSHYSSEVKSFLRLGKPMVLEPIHRNTLHCTTVYCTVRYAVPIMPPVPAVPHLRAVLPVPVVPPVQACEPMVPTVPAVPDVLPFPEAAVPSQRVVGIPGTACIIFRTHGTNVVAHLALKSKHTCTACIIFRILMSSHTCRAPRSRQKNRALSQAVFSATASSFGPKSMRCLFVRSFLFQCSHAELYARLRSSSKPSGPSPFFVSTGKM